MKRWLFAFGMFFAVISVIIAIMIHDFKEDYTRPMTLEQIYPSLNRDDFVRVRVYYQVGVHEKIGRYSISEDHEQFDELWDLFMNQTYRRSLTNLFPRRDEEVTMRYKGDYLWSVMFQLDDIPFPNGSVASGDMLQFHYTYGELSMLFNREEMYYDADQLDTWSETVLDKLLE